MIPGAVRLWARCYVSPLSFTACGHARHDRNLAGQATCRDCGHQWTEHPIDIHDDVYDTLVGYMARILDNK